MTRLRLFLFYSLMAWASVIRPAEGTKMIDDAEAGLAERQRRRLLEAQDRLVQKVGPGWAAPPDYAPLRTPSNSTLALAVVVLLMITGGWLALIIDAAIGWLQ